MADRIVLGLLVLSLAAEAGGGHSEEHALDRLPGLEQTEPTEEAAWIRGFADLSGTASISLTPTGDLKTD